MQQRTKQFNILSFILLIILVIVFYKELFILGVRLYASFTDSVQANYLLGKYYSNAANENANYSNVFYQKAMTQYIEKLAKAEDKEKAELNFIVGRFYECSQGTKADRIKARIYYQEAQKASGNSSQKDKLDPEVQEALKRTSDSSPQASKIYCDSVAEIILLDGVSNKHLNPQNNNNHTNNNDSQQTTPKNNKQ